MPLAPGTRLGPYELSTRIGAGGMGEVYRAADTKLKRDVAVKVLPAGVATDLDRLERLQREARILASLNHPNIAHVYGIEDSAGLTALVMELVEGPTLADRIAQEPMSVAEALLISKQIAAALEAAHEQGIIHRDLKPANVKVRLDGTVKVLDFGLAKTMESSRVASGERSESPTITTPAFTAAGLILGTAAYMPPEQARGKPLDRRADVWAFGCVLYEMLAGRRAFPGETISDTFAAILATQPDWNALPAATPPRLRWLMRRCVEKDLNRRLHDIADARIELDEMLVEPTEPGADRSLDRSPPAARSTLRERIAWIVAGVCLIAFVAVLVSRRTGLSNGPSSANVATYRSSILLPEHVSFSTLPAGRFALSPNGRRVAFAGADGNGESQLWVRSLDSTVAQPLAGTDGAAFPFWSPDSRYIAFISLGKLKKIDATGGPVTTLCDAAPNATGAWNTEDVILFTPPGGSPLYRVSALGGTPTPATTLDPANGESQHWFPFFLPDNRHFLYFAMGSKSGGAIDPRAVYVGSLDPNEPNKLILQRGSNAKYASGHLFFLRGRTLMAQPFDVSRLELTDQPVPVAEQVQVPGAGDTGTAGAFSVADTGAIAYQTGLDQVRSQLVWFDRGGKQMALLGDPADYAEVVLSVEGRQAAVSVLDPAKNTYDLWVYDVARGLRTRFTSDASDEIGPVWSPDLGGLMFASGRKGGFDVYRQAPSGSSDELVLEDSLGEFPESISPDGRFLLYVFGSGTLRRSDLWVLPLAEPRKPFPFLETPFVETQGQFSPNGRWIAYSSNESGQMEVYVAPFPGPGSRWRISPAGGSWPRWRRDGAEIFYLTPGNTLSSATVSDKGADFSVGEARPLFTVRPRPRVRLDAFPYDVSADGQRFLVNSFVEETASTAITLVINWSAGGISP
ncbi:MAG TPA: protein kinase [Vicinamibacterales bacterium]|nr:protein kinase [Vicinamibacterales bacterium]